MSKQITTTQLLKVELLKNSTVEQKVKNTLQQCKKLGYTHNKQNKAISKDRLLWLCKAMLKGISNGKKGWWNTYKVVSEEKTDNVKIELLKVK